MNELPFIRYIEEQMDDMSAADINVGYLTGLGDLGLGLLRDHCLRE